MDLHILSAIMSYNIMNYLSHI